MKDVFVSAVAMSVLMLLVINVSGEEIRARVVDVPNLNVPGPAPMPAPVPFEMQDNRNVAGEIWGGLGGMGGDVTYQIGGAFVDASGPSYANFPLSELKWPLNVLTATVGGSLNIVRYVELTGMWSGNLSSGAGRMEDSDWEDPDRPRVKTIFSTSDADLDVMTADIGLRCWVINWVLDPRTSYSMGLGGGWLYQDLKWDASNLDQWYPSDPRQGHDYQYGLVGTYKTKVNMPYIEFAGEMRMPWLSFFGSFGYSPSTRVSDEDDHIVRSILAKTDADGDAVKISLLGRCDYNDYVYGVIRADFISYSVDGTENDITYAGADAGATWSIHHEITSVQENITIALGVKF